MTALEAYALAKQIATSAVTGINSLSVDGTTLIIKTNDGNTLEMVFPTPADGRSIVSANINEEGHLIFTYDDDEKEDAGLIPTKVEVTSVAREGTKIANIKVNGESTDIFIPEDLGTKYSKLTDKPSINGNTLSGNKSTSDLALADEDTIIVKDDKLTINTVDDNDIESLFNN